MTCKFFADIFIEEPFFNEIAIQLGGVKKKGALMEKVPTRTVAALLVGRRRQ